MLIRKSYRYELKPNNKQRGLFIKSCGVARFAYNWGLAKRKELYYTKQGKERFTTAITQHKELNAIKKETLSWMYEVSKYIPQESLKDLEQGYNLFYKLHKGDKHMKLPKFKKKGVHDSFRIINNFDLHWRTIEAINKSIKLPKMGWIRTKENTNKLQGRILNATITREANKWFCSLNVEIEKRKPKQIIGDIIGIDLGIKCFATISNGKGITNIQSPKPLRKYAKRQKLLNRRHDKKKKGSNNRAKARIRLARLHLRIKNTRKDFLAKLSSELAKTKSVICIEDLNIQGLLNNHSVARAISDEGWGTFRRMLKYKTEWYGSKLVVIPRFEPSSKRCNHCGAINKNLTLSDRTWVCSNCGAINERDPNASHNIRDKGIKLLSTDSLSGFQACGVDVRPSHLMAIDRETGSKHTSKRGKTYKTAKVVNIRSKHE